jgi:Ion channel
MTGPKMRRHSRPAQPSSVYGTAGSGPAGWRSGGGTDSRYRFQPTRAARRPINPCRRPMIALRDRVWRRATRAAGRRRRTAPYRSVEGGAGKMLRSEIATARRSFLRALLRGLRVLWLVLSGLLAVIGGLGVAVGLAEGWGVGNGVYFASVTGLTVGYADLSPSRPLTKVLAAAIGVLGVAATGLVAALAVTAFEAAGNGRGLPDRHDGGAGYPGRFRLRRRCGSCRRRAGRRDVRPRGGSAVPHHPRSRRSAQNSGTLPKPVGHESPTRDGSGLPTHCAPQKS